MFKILFITFIISLTVSACGGDNFDLDAPSIGLTESITVTTISFSWNKPKSKEGIDKYIIYRDDVKITTLSKNATSYTDSGLTPDTTYTYYVEVVDILKNYATSKKKEFSTLADTEAPSIAIIADTASSTDTSITINWSEATDNVELANYSIHRNNSSIGLVDAFTSTYTDSGLTQGSTYSYYITAIDTFDNQSSSDSKSFSTTDTEAPSTPTNFAANNISSSSVSLSWNASTDNFSDVTYRIYRNGQSEPVAENITSTSFQNTNLVPSTIYNYTVTAVDTTDNESSHSQALEVTTTDSSITSTTFPSQVNLSWEGPNNTAGDITYLVYRDETLIATTTQQSYRDRKLQSNTSYSYRVMINDAGNGTPLAGGLVDVQTSQRNHTIQVYETAGIDINNHPVSVFIPLPFGVYTQSESELADTFIIHDANNQAVPAQYWVRSRWHNRDNSIRELVAVFKASVSANGIAEYQLSRGTSPEPTVPISVSNEVNQIIVSNEHISFTLNKQSFNLLDSVRYKGNVIIDNNNEDGGYIINRFGNTYRESDDCTTANNTQPSQTPLIFEVEEAGPVRARVRVERPAYTVQDSNDPCHTLFSENKDPVPGMVVWFDLYYDSDKIVINHNILNNAITPYRNGIIGDGIVGWPLFFEEAGFALRSPLNGLSATIGTDLGDTTYTAPVIQESATELMMDFALIGSQGSTLTLSNSDGNGFTIIDPFFDKTFPNGWEFDDTTGRVLFKTAPDGCVNCEGYHFKTQASNSSLYTLNDLSVKDKRFVLQFFDDSTVPDQAYLNQLHSNPPVATLSVKDYSTLGTTTDLFGFVYPLTEQSGTVDTSYKSFTPHQQTFGINMGRYRSCTSGGVPYVALDHLVVRPPRINTMDVEMYDDIKRPQIIPHYWSGVEIPLTYNAFTLGPDLNTSSSTTMGHHATEFSSSGYCKNLPIRAFQANNISTYVAGKIFPIDSSYAGSMTAYPRDNQHLWMQQLSDAPVDNPMLEYFKRGYEHYLQGYGAQLESNYVTLEKIYESQGDRWPSNAVRAIGNSLISMVDFYLESGDTDTLSAIESTLDVILTVQLDHGGLREKLSFQDGYMMTGVINAMSAVDKDHAIFKKGWKYLFGTGQNTDNEGIIDAMLTIEFGDYEFINCKTNAVTPCISSGRPSGSLVDPGIVSAYLLATIPSPYTDVTDGARAQELVAHIMNYINGLYGKRPYQVNADWQTSHWSGTTFNRTPKIANDINELPTHLWQGIIHYKEGMPLYD